MLLDPSRVHKPGKKLRKLVKKMPKQPAPEQVHDIRTDTRRLEAIANALSLEGSGNVRKLLKDLSRIRKRAGKVRDIDVLTGYAANVDAGEEQAGHPPSCKTMPFVHC